MGVSQDGKLFVWTQPEAWKVRRIEATPHVTAAECTWRGRPVGPSFSAIARVLHPQESDQLYRSVVWRSGLAGKFAVLTSRLRNGSAGTVALELTPAT